MNILGNNRGVALVTSLMLTLISLGVIMALLSIILAGTKMGASQKRYRNALSASYGGVEVTTKDLIPKILNGMTDSALNSSFSLINLTLQNSACIRQKLALPTASWTDAVCGANRAIPDAAIAPDVRFTLTGASPQTNYNIAAKIVDTVPGNSDPSGTEMLDPGMAVAGSTPGISPMHLPALLTIEVEGTQGNQPQEKADLSVLYAY